MDKDEARELNREAKQEKYEHYMNKECKSIGKVLDNNNIDSCFEDQYNIVIMYNKYGVELSDLDLTLYDNVEQVIEALDGIR